MPRKSTTGLVPFRYLQDLFNTDSVLDFITDDDHDLQEEKYDHVSFYSVCQLVIQITSWSIISKL